MKIQVKKLREGARLPHLATQGSAACDLYALLEKPLTLRPGERVSVPTGLALALPDPSFVAVVCARSGLALKRGLSLANGIGVIDSDYRGEIFVALINLSQKSYTIAPKERIAQLVIMPAPPVLLKETANLNDTARNTGGFGSTGR